MLRQHARLGSRGCYSCIASDLNVEGLHLKEIWSIHYFTIKPLPNAWKTVASNCAKTELNSYDVQSKAPSTPR
jgi:hypothetical protein